MSWVINCDFPSSFGKGRLDGDDDAWQTPDYESIGSYLLFTHLYTTVASSGRIDIKKER